ncbi:MAG: PD-(D/E)XK nuclease family transposase [Roseburia sp.]|nr:PD-(D/E)XK nuclease family transposase [Roseburia sp.]
MTRKKQKTLEEKIEQVKNFRPIDDTFFEVLADDIGVCQEMLRIILEDEKLIVKDVIVQSSERNLYGRSVRLDALCILGNGKKCNVEVQRSNKDHHLKRVRFNASVITVRDSQTDDKFEETIDLIVVHISEFDIFKRGRVIYHVDSVIQEKVDDGLERVFVNTTVKDETSISEYMGCFQQKEIDNAKFPKLTNRVHYLKHEEGGVNAVCEIMRKYSDEAYKQGEEAGKEIGQRQANITAIKNMIIRFHATKEVILEDYTESEYNTAIAELQAKAK